MGDKRYLEALGVLLGIDLSTINMKDGKVSVSLD